MKFFQAISIQFSKVKRETTRFQAGSMLWMLVGSLVCFIVCTYLPFLNFSISLSQNHPFFLNVFFVNYTFMGNCLFASALILIIALYFKKYRLAGSLFISVFLSVIFVQIIKNLMHNDAFSWYIERGQYLFFEEESGLGNYYSFPSGYTATGFAIASIIAANQRNFMKVLLIYIGAGILGFSRIYLAQHNLAEVFAGATIGLTAAFISLKIVQNFESGLNTIRNTGKNNQSTVFSPGFNWKKAY
jgi:membrane-associated phospholipid phosphatase